MQMGPKNYVVLTTELHYKNHVRITSQSYIRLMLENYVIKPCKWNQKVT